MRSFMNCYALRVLAMVAMATTVSAAEPTLVRDLYLGSDQLPVLLESAPQRVLLSTDEYRELVERAAVKTPQTHQPPQGFMMTAAHYQIRVESGRAVIHGTLDVDVLVEGLLMVPIELNGVGLVRATVDGRTASVGRSPSGAVHWFVEGRGRKQLELEMLAPVETLTTRQSLKMRLPHSPSNRWELTVAGNVEIKQGGSVVSRAVDEQLNVTRFKLLVSPGPTDLQWTLNNRQQRTQRVVHARSLTIVSLSDELERLEASFALEALQRPVDAYQFDLPEGFQIVDLQSPHLARWTITAGEKSRVLNVQLREATKERVILRLVAERTGALKPTWSLSVVRPRDVEQHTGLIGVRLDEHWQYENPQPQGLLGVDVAALRDTSSNDSSSQRIVAAYYATSDQAQLVAQVRRPEPRLNVVSADRFTLGDRSIDWQGSFQLLAQSQPRHMLDLIAPANWSIETIQLGDQPLAWERYPLDATQARYHLTLLKPLVPNSPLMLHVSARHTPDGWLSNWKQRDWNVPRMTLRDATVTRGSITLVSIDDLRLRPATVEGVEPIKADHSIEVEQSLAYRFTTDPIRLSTRVERIEPRLTARTLVASVVDEDVVHTHAELIYDVQQAHVDRLTFLLPHKPSAEVIVRGLDGVDVKQTSSTQIEAGQLWTVELNERRRGPIRLAVQFAQSVGVPKDETVVLPSVWADGVAYQSGLLAVESVADLDVQLLDPPASVDVGQWAEAEYSPGRHLLGVYRFVGQPSVLQIKRSRPSTAALPTAIVQSQTLHTIVGTGGRSVNWIDLDIRSKVTYLELALPVGFNGQPSILWSAQLNNMPLKPQRLQDRLLINLPSLSQANAQQLQIVYETAIAPISALGHLTMPAARVYLPGREGRASVEVPVAVTRWDVQLPPDYMLGRSRGSVHPTIVAAPRLAAFEVAEGLWLAGGGVFGGPLRRSSTPVFFIQESEDALLGVIADKEMTGKPTSVKIDIGEVNVFKSNGAQLSQELPAGTLGEAKAIADNYEQALKERNKKLSDGVMPKSEAKPAGPATPPAALAVEGGRGRGEGKGEALDKNARIENRKGFLLTGVRALPIDLQESGKAITFTNLSGDARLDLIVVDRQRLSSLSSAIAWLVALYGLYLLWLAPRRRLRYVVTVGVLTTLVPLVSGWLELAVLLNPAFYAACGLLVVYGFVGLIHAVRSCGCCVLKRRTATPASVGLLLLTLITAYGSTATAQEPNDVEASVAKTPIHIPDDATIWLYDQSSGLKVPQAKQVLVPLARYEQLWAQAYPEQAATKKLPARFALIEARYRATLGDEATLHVDGELELQAFDHEPIDVPLAITGGVIMHSTLDDRPTTLKLLVPEVVPAQKGQNGQPLPVKPLPVLVVQGAGRHRLQLRVGMNIEREGGWRRVAGQLPTAAATPLRLTLPQPNMEMELIGVHDRARHESLQPNETIDTALSAAEAFRWAWRLKAAQGQVDAGLQAVSQSHWLIQEDGWRLTAQVQLQFRGGSRDRFTLKLDTSAGVDRVQGENVRGWELSELNGQRLLEVSLLKAATASEQLTIILSQRQPLSTEVIELTAPNITVRDAALQQGSLVIERSRAVNVRTVETLGASRMDLPPVVVEANASAESPLGREPLEAYRFSTLPIKLRVAAQLQESSLRTDTRATVTLGPSESRFEANVACQVTGRPRFALRFELPLPWTIEHLSGAGSNDWSLLMIDNRRVVEVRMSEGRVGDFSLQLTGQANLPANDTAPRPLPQLRVLDAQQQLGTIQVQSPAAYRVDAERLVNCTTTLLLDATSGRRAAPTATAQLAVKFNSADYEAVVRLTRRTPRVTCTTINSTRITSRAFEESILLDYQVQDAGVREVQFLIHESLRDARVRAPLMRELTYEPVEGRPGWLRAKLTLQDELLGELRVLVEHDRVRSNEPQQVSIAVVENARVAEQFVLLESDGDLEVALDRQTELEPLARQQDQYRQLVEMLRIAPTLAFRVATGAKQPQLVYSLRERAKVTTAQARIGLAETFIMVDREGNYRATQTYRLDNKTEPYLTLELPRGAEVWSAWVAGEPIKPVEQPGPTGARGLQLPLVKTAEGDLDYRVIVKYGGRLERLGWSSHVTFPFLRTVNINVEQSRVEVYLPEDLHWYSFDGTLGTVADANEYANAELSHYNRLTQRLSQLLSSDDRFAKVRALNSYSSLNTKLNDYQRDVNVSNQSIVNELNANRAALDQAQQSQAMMNQPAVQQAAETDVRRSIEQRYRSQQNDLGRQLDSVSQDKHFALRGGKVLEQLTPRTEFFDRRWLVGNALSELRSDSLVAGDKPSEAKKSLKDEKGKAGTKSTTEQDRTKSLPTAVPTPQAPPATTAPAKPDAQMQNGAPAQPPGQNITQRYQQKLQAQTKNERDGVVDQAGGGKQEQAERQLARKEVERSSQLAAGIASPYYLSDDIGYRPSGTSSLDVDWIAQGRVYRFTTSGGDLHLQARGVSWALLEALGRLALVVLTVVALRWVAKSLTVARLQAWSRSPWCAGLLLGGGLLSLLLMALPIFGLLAIVTGMTVSVRALWFRAERTTPAGT